ncbi:EF-hand domain-containing protein [Temperatibacter marinus]|uniref:EF-hand domain-containing protein n=1 Tax=Temperatibacter marinus TaxID=1456591 RepID=A0AA52ED16_9PROT|nr:EF-hand domain-containing protein [Temperatibacter marinus]WND02445.1 EF-hand domain-containing protein [Temperatibacter marinus]
MNKKIKTLTVGVILSVSVTGLSGLTADDHKMKRKEMRKKMLEHIETSFAKRDLNGDGSISHAEMMEQVSHNFSKIDVNKDGKIVLEELPQDLSKLRQMIGAGEMNPLRKRLQAKREEMQHEKQHAEKKLKKKPTRMGMIARMDRDGDEAISLEEFSKRAVKRFKRADRNGDGLVSLKETKKALKKGVKTMRKKNKKKRARSE